MKKQLTEKQLKENRFKDFLNWWRCSVKGRPMTVEEFCEIYKKI